MLFSRRTKRSFWQKVREALWPRMGLQRLFSYYHHRMGRLKESPTAIAFGFATGVAISFTPFLGFHLILAGVITWLLDGSLIAMVLGSVLAGNFWTYPLIFVGTYKLGKLMMGLTPREHPRLRFTWEFLLNHPMDYLVPMTLGSLPLVVASWIAAFYVARRIVAGYKVARRGSPRRHSIKEKK
jgi:uncharacterized protein (DUF2062 family)